MKTCPSCCSPRRATNRPPGLTSLESVKSWVNVTSCGPLSSRPRVASTTSFTDMPTAALFSLLRWDPASRRDRPLRDQGAGDGFPDGGSDIGAFEEALRLARDHQHDERRMIDGHEADEGADGVIWQIFPVFRDARRAGLAGDPVLEAVDPGGKTGAVLDHPDHHLLHLLRGLGADDLPDDARLNRVAGPGLVDHLVHDVRPDPGAAGGRHVDGGQHLDRRSVNTLALGRGRQPDRFPPGVSTDRL